MCNLIGVIARMKSPLLKLPVVIALISGFSCVQIVEDVENDCFSARARRTNFGATTNTTLTIWVEEKRGGVGFSGRLAELEGGGYGKTEMAFLDSNTLLVSTGYSSDYDSGAKVPIFHFISNLEYPRLPCIEIGQVGAQRPFVEDTIEYIQDSIPPFVITLSQTGVVPDARIVRLRTWDSQLRAILIRPVEKLEIEQVSEYPFRIKVYWKDSTNTQHLLIMPKTENAPMRVSLE